MDRYYNPGSLGPELNYIGQHGGYSRMILDFCYTGLGSILAQLSRMYSLIPSPLGPLNNEPVCTGVSLGAGYWVSLAQWGPLDGAAQIQFIRSTLNERDPKKTGDYFFRFYDIDPRNLKAAKPSLQDLANFRDLTQRISPGWSDKDVGFGNPFNFFFSGDFFQGLADGFDWFKKNPVTSLVLNNLDKIAEFTDIPELNEIGKVFDGIDKSTHQLAAGDYINGLNGLVDVRDHVNSLDPNQNALKPGPNGEIQFPRPYPPSANPSATTTQQGQNAQTTTNRTDLASTETLFGNLFGAGVKAKKKQKPVFGGSVYYKGRSVKPMDMMMRDWRYDAFRA